MMWEQDNAILNTQTRTETLRWLHLLSSSLLACRQTSFSLTCKNSTTLFFIFTCFLSSLIQFVIRMTQLHQSKKGSRSLPKVKLICRSWFREQTFLSWKKTNHHRPSLLLDFQLKEGELLFLPYLSALLLELTAFVSSEAFNILQNLLNWGFGVLGFWGFGVLGFWGFGLFCFIFNFI